MSETETEEIVDDAGRRGRIVGLRRPLDEEDEEPWTVPPSRRRPLPAIAGALLAHIGAVLGDQLYVVREGLPPGLINRLARLAAFQIPAFYAAQPIHASKALRTTVNGGLRVVDSSSFELCRLKLARSNTELGRGTVRGNEGVHMLVDSPRDAPERGRERSGSDPAESVAKGMGGALVENTERALRSDLAIFRSWCDQHGEAAVPASVDTLVGFIEAMACERIRRRLLTSLRKTG